MIVQNLFLAEFELIICMITVIDRIMHEYKCNCHYSLCRNNYTMFALY